MVGKSVATSVQALGASTATAAAASEQQGQGVAALLVMLAVLCFILAYCCWGAPFCRALCRRHCCCRLEDADTCTDSESGGFSSVGLRQPSSGAARANADQAMLATPTIILLPHGRMLVVDGTIFTQFQADNTGLDLVELGESVMRAQRNPGGVARRQLQNSQGSILEMDVETPSKESMGSLGCFPPPTYESIYGKEETGDMPPSYSDILLHRLAHLPFDIEMREYGKEEHEWPGQVIGNPLDGLSYPEGSGPRGYWSRSLPRNAGTRHVLANPLDSYHEDDEVTGPGHRRRSASSLAAPQTATPRASPRSRRTSCHDADLAPINRASEGAVDGAAHDEPALGITVDSRFVQPWNQSRRIPNDSMNSRNSARSDSRMSEDLDDLPRSNLVYVRSRRSEGSIADENIRTHRRERRIATDPVNWDLNNLDVRYTSNENGHENFTEGHTGDSDNASAEEDPNNFKALPDIRESRV